MICTTCEEHDLEKNKVLYFGSSGGNYFMSEGDLLIYLDDEVLDTTPTEVLEQLEERINQLPEWWFTRKTDRHMCLEGDFGDSLHYFFDENLKLRMLYSDNGNVFVDIKESGSDWTFVFPFAISTDPFSTYQYVQNQDNEEEEIVIEHCSNGADTCLTFHKVNSCTNIFRVPGTQGEKLIHYYSHSEDKLVTEPVLKRIYLVEYVFPDLID